MILIRILFCLPLILFSISMASASTNLHQSISASLGMVNVTVTENASSLKAAEGDAATDATGGQSASVSVVSMDLVYEFDNHTRKSYFLKATAPLLAADGSGYYLGGLGMNYYFNSLSSLFTFNNEGTSLTMNPTMRYYWGAAGGIGFVVYSTETAKKSDLIFDLQLHGGGIFNFKRDWGIRGEAAISRGTGVATSTIGIKLFFGINYYLEK